MLCRRIIILFISFEFFNQISCVLCRLWKQKREQLNIKHLRYNSVKFFLIHRALNLACIISHSCPSISPSYWMLIMLSVHIYYFLFLQEVMDHFHPVFRHFFMEKYTEPSRWFECRLSYTRSVAASSIGNVYTIMI